MGVLFSLQRSKQKVALFFLNEIKPDNVFSGVGYAATININNDDVDVFNLYILDP